MLLVANLANEKRCKKAEKLKMGIHLRVLGESYLMNTIMTGFRWLSKYLHYCDLDESSPSIRRVKSSPYQPQTLIKVIRILGMSSQLF